MTTTTMRQTTDPAVPAWESPYFTGFDDGPYDPARGDAVDAGLSRRQFVKVLGAGLLIAATGVPAAAQVAPGGQGNRPGGRGGRPGGGGGGFRGGGRPTTVAARLHVGKDGVITVMTGKVECGQGARAELTQAAAEELRVAADRVLLVMADTGLVPDDGMTAGSRSTPSTVPAIRQGAAAAREMLADLACKRWNVQRAEVEVKDGKVVHGPSAREMGYAELAAADDAVKAFGQNVPQGVTVTPVKEWRVMGTPVARPNRRDLVSGGHHYPSDVVRPGMLYGKVLRAPSYGATLADADLGPAKAMKDVMPVRDGAFVGVVAPTSFLAREAIEAVEKAARWDTKPHPPSSELYDHLRKNVRGGVPKNPNADDVAKAAKSVRATYHVAYVQHAPLEPRAAVAEWEGNKLTVWTGTQNPFGVRGELARTMNVPESDVRVIVPDFGGGFGGKHSGEAAVEAARLARAAGKPVSLRWTRREEFTWAYFRPAGVIDAEAGLDAAGRITSWHFVNINSGPSAVETPYRVGKGRSQFVPSDAPLKQGSYRGLASTANTFARECFMDELAEAAGQDPLAFRLAHLEDVRLRGVLEEAAKQFDWAGRAKPPKSDGDVVTSVGLACGTEKGSFTAACVEVSIDRKAGKVKVRRVCQAYDCGTVVNPVNLTSQVEGAICMGLGPLLREEIRFEGGKVTNAAFAEYHVPRFDDVPAIDVHLINPTDAPPVGAGETPIIAVAPAVANAVSRAVGRRVREMPMRVGKAE